MDTAWLLLIPIAMRFVLLDATHQCFVECFDAPCPCACLVAFCGPGTANESISDDVKLTVECSNSEADAQSIVHWNPTSLGEQVNNDDPDLITFNIDYICYNSSSSGAQELTHNSFGGSFEQGSTTVHPPLPTGKDIFCTFHGCVLDCNGCWIYLEDETNCTLGLPQEVTSTTQLSTKMSLTQPSLSSLVVVSNPSPTQSVLTTVQPSTGGLDVISVVVAVVLVIVILIGLISITTVCLTLCQHSKKNWINTSFGNSRLLSEPSGVMNPYTIAPFDNMSVTSSVVTVVHPLDYKDMSNESQCCTEKSHFTSVGTEKVAEQLSDCSADLDSATEKYFRQSPPQNSEVSAEDDYTYINADTASNPSVHVHSLELAYSPSSSAGFVITKESSCFDTNKPSEELPEMSTAQYYDDNHDENATNIFAPGIKRFRKEYVQGNFSVPDSSHIFGATDNLEDFDETRTENSLLHNLCDNRVFNEETCPFSQSSCSATENISQRTSPVESNEQAISYKEDNSPRLMSSNSEYGYIQFESINTQDIPQLLISEQERHNSPCEKGVCVASSDLEQHQSQAGSSMDNTVDSFSVEDKEPHINKNKYLVSLSKYHGSVSSTDNGIVRTCDLN